MWRGYGPVDGVLFYFGVGLPWASSRFGEGTVSSPVSVSIRSPPPTTGLAG